MLEDHPHPSLSSPPGEDSAGPKEQGPWATLSSLWNPEILCPNSPEPTSRSLSAPSPRSEVTSRGDPSPPEHEDTQAQNG